MSRKVFTPGVLQFTLAAGHISDHLLQDPVDTQGNKIARADKRQIFLDLGRHPFYLAHKNGTPGTPIHMEYSASGKTESEKNKELATLIMSAGYEENEVNAVQEDMDRFHSNQGFVNYAESFFCQTTTNSFFNFIRNNDANGTQQTGGFKLGSVAFQERSSEVKVIITRNAEGLIKYDVTADVTLHYVGDKSISLLLGRTTYTIAEQRDGKRVISDFKSDSKALVDLFSVAPENFDEQQKILGDIFREQQIRNPSWTMSPEHLELLVKHARFNKIPLNLTGLDLTGLDLEGIIVDKAGYQSLKTGLRKSNGFTEADIAQLRKVCTASNITDSYLGLREKELALSPATVTSKRGDSPVSEAGTHVSSNAQGDTTSDADQDKHLPASAPVIGAENIINALTHAQGLGKINSATIYKLKNGLEIKLDPKNYLDGFAKSAYKLMAAAEDGKPRWVDRDVLFPTSEKGFSEVDRMSKHFVNAKEVREVDAVSVNTTETKKPPSKRISSQGNNYALYYCAKAQIAKELENPKIHADEKEKLVLGLVTAAKELTVPLDLSELDLQDVNLDAVREIMLIVSPDKAESTNPNGTRKSDNERTLNEGVTVDALKNAADLSKTINLMPTLINGMNISDNTKAMIHAVRGANLSNVIFDFPVWYRHYQHFVEVKTSHCDLFEKLNSLYPKAKKFSNYFDAEEYAKKNPQGDTAKAINNINYGLLYESFNLKTLTVNDIKLLIDTAKTSNIKLYLKDCKLSGDLTEIDLSKADLTGCTFDFLKDQDRVFQDQNTTITGEQVALFVKAGVTDFSNITIIGKIPKSVVVKKGPDESNKLDFSRSNLKDATFESFITYESIKAEGLSNAELSRDQVRQMAAGGVEMQTKLSKAKFTAENTAGVNLSGVSKLKVDTKNEFSPPDATLSNSVVAQLKAADGRPKANAAQTSGTGKITAPEKYIVQNTYKLPINRGTAPKTNVEKTPLADDRVFVSSMAKKLVVKVRADTIPDLKNTSLKYTDPTKTDLGERITLYSAILDEKKIDKTQCVVIDPNAAPTTDVTTQSDALQVIPLSSAIDTDLSTAITAIYTALASGKTFIIASQEGKNTGENDVQAVAPKLTNTSLAEALSALALEFTDLRTFRKNLDNLVVFVKWIDSKGGVDVLRKMTEVNRNVMIDAALTEKINASSFSLFNTKYDEPVAKIYKGMDGSEKNVFNGFIAAFKNGLDVKPVDRSEPVVGRGLSIMAPKN